MKGQARSITLCIRETEGPDSGFLFHILLDGEVDSSNQSLSTAESKAVLEFSHRYSALFEQHNQQPRIAAENLSALGEELFAIWLERYWREIMLKVPVGLRRQLVIASGVPDVLNLPWELLRPPGSDFLAFDPKFGIRRLPWANQELSAFAGPLPPRPLRILFMACAPQDQPELDYEREENSLLRAIANAGPNVAFDSGDLGTFEELRQRINEFQPQVVHLTGHGILGRKCPNCGLLNEPQGRVCQNKECALELKGTVLGYFAFEDADGGTDLRSSTEIRQELFAGSSVQCAFVSGCQTGKAPPVAALGGICQGLVSDEVPLAIGWAASIADDVAIKFAKTLYNTLASGQSVDRALIQSRQAVRKICEERSDPSWTLPVLYAATAQGLVFDPDPNRPPERPMRPSVVQQPLPGMTEGYAEDFVNRRRELQRVLPALREGRIQILLITGLGGTGKSTLATRLARKLESDGFTPIPVPSSSKNPLSAARLLQACRDLFRQAGRQHLARGERQLATELEVAARDSDNAQLSIRDRLRDIVSVLNRSRFLLILDNFEVNMDEATRRILDTDLFGFYAHLKTHLSGSSRCIITSRYRPAEVYEEKQGEQ